MSLLILYFLNAVSDFWRGARHAKNLLFLNRYHTDLLVKIRPGSGQDLRLEDFVFDPAILIHYSLFNRFQWLLVRLLHQ